MEDGGNRKPGFNITGKNKKFKIPNGMFYIFLFLLFIVILQGLNNASSRELRLTFNEFNELIASSTISGAKAPEIKEAVVVKKEEGIFEFQGVFSAPFYPKESVEARRTSFLFPTQEGSYTRFAATIPEADSEMRALWDAKGFSYEFQIKGVNWLSMFFSFLPWLLFIGIWIFMIRNISGGAGGGGAKGLFNFGKSKAKLMGDDGAQKVTFKDVAGCDESKQELSEVVDFLKDSNKFKNLGGRIPKGVLLVGSPGTGKTLLAKAVAGEAGVPFFSISGSDFVEMFVGVGASRVRDLFEKGKKYAPCILFIDEIDAVARQRGAGVGGGHDEREQTLNQLLVEMDGMETRDSVIIIAATNRPDILDPAILRPGRFDRNVIIDKPDIKGRLGILKVHIDKQKVPLADNVDLNVIATTTPGLSGAELANVVNEAALMAARVDAKKVYMKHFEEARDKITIGVERKTRKISEKERKVTAYHEAGHAICAHLIPEADKVHKVTIIPRGMALGVTHTLPDGDKYMYSKEYILSQIAVLFSGRVAEMIVFKEETTGASNDIKRATELARKMVCEWGMSAKIGPIALEDRKELLFLGREIEKHKEYSEKVAELIDEEVKSIIYGRIEFVFNMLNKNRDKLETMAQALLKYETLSSKDIENIFAGKEIVREDEIYETVETEKEGEKEVVSDAGKNENSNEMKSNLFGDE